MFGYSILLILSTGRLNLGINITDKDENVKNLFIACSFVLFFFLIVLINFSFFFPKAIITIFGFNSIKIFYILVITVFFSSCLEILLSLANRNGLFNEIAISKIIFSSTSVFFQILFGYLNFGALGLILSMTLSKLIVCIYMLNIQKKTIKLFVNFKIQNVIVTITRFKNFIFYDIPSSLLSVSSIQLLIIFNLIYTSFLQDNIFYSKVITSTCNNNIRFNFRSL